MTTIVCNRRHMASDTLLASYTKESVNKIWRVGNSLVGIAGVYSECVKFVRWLKEPGSIDENDIEVSEVSALVLKDSGISVYDGGFSPYSIQDQFAAIGTGAMAALGVMYVLEALEASVSDDKSVQLAVGTSMRVDPMSGGKIAVRTLVGSQKVLYLP